MMSASSVAPALAHRLERLTGEEAACCVPEYRGLAREIEKSGAFAAALRHLRALADNRRLLAVALLRRRRELCACEIQAAMGLSHATVSHHMSILIDSGLVAARREGKWMYYRLTGSPGIHIP